MIITTHLDADGFDPSTDDGSTEGRIDFRPFDTPYPNPALIEWRTPLTAILDDLESMVTTAEREQAVFEERVALIKRLPQPHQYVRKHFHELVTLTTALHDECPGFFTFHAAIAEVLILLRYEHKLAADRAALVAMHKEAGLDSIGIQIAAQDKQQGGK
jgi:hypothetical protein